MNRKRLLTILAGATAAMALQLGPAAALDLGVAKVDTSDGLSVEADVEVGDDEDGVKLDPKIKVGSSDGTKVEGGASAGDTKVDAGETTKKVEDTVKSTTDKATGGGGSGGTDDGGSSSGGSSSDGSSSSSGSSGGSSSSESQKSSKSSNDEVKTASRAQMAFGTEDSSPSAAMNRLSGIEFSPSSAPAGQGLGGSVTPAFDLSEFDPDAEFQEPLIAAPGNDFSSASGDESSRGDGVAAPEVAAPPRADAELATSPATDGTGTVPAGLKLLAASLVAGTGAIWHMARREVGLR
jgi:hypothetical protein